MYGVGKVIDLTLGFRADGEDRRTGPDLTVGAGTAYDHGVPGNGAPVGSSPSAQKVERQA